MAQNALWCHNVKCHLNACQELVERKAGSKIIRYHFDSKHKWQSPLLIFVIARISLQNTNIHLKVERSGLGAMLNVI